MDEQELRLLSSDELLTLMMKITGEVLAIHRNQEDRKLATEKLKQIQLIQKIFSERRDSTL
ncbi:MAG: hypothetical protein EOP48_30775 [Sphingobacteriales bacterium]|nr:MAG: hypothetical protein EOP48_30775 [Sphingobacteriales bacterium]